MPKGDICSVQNCFVITRYGDICDNHRWRFKKYGSYDLPDRSIIKICKAPNCDRPVDKAQHSRLCVMHRVRWSRHKSYNLPVKTLPDGIVHICKVHGPLNGSQAWTNDNYPSYQCKACKKNSALKYRLKNPDRDCNANKKYHYIGKSGLKITKELYNNMHDEQGGLCAICKNPEKCVKSNSTKLEPKKLAVDHCHEAQKLGVLKVRGLLCHSCNTMLGVKRSIFYKSDAAQEYLKKHQS